MFLWLSRFVAANKARYWMKSTTQKQRADALAKSLAKGFQEENMTNVSCCMRRGHVRRDVFFSTKTLKAKQNTQNFAPASRIVTMLAGCVGVHDPKIPVADVGKFVCLPVHPLRGKELDGGAVVRRMLHGLSRSQRPHPVRKVSVRTCRASRHRRIQV